MEQEFYFEKLIYLGSCGGYHSIPMIYERLSGKVTFITSKNMGVGEVNNLILNYTAEAISQRLVNWGEVKDYVDKKMQKHPSLLEQYQSYQFPGSLPDLILRKLDIKY